MTTLGHWARLGTGLLRLVRPRLLERPAWRWRFRNGLPGADPEGLRQLLPYGGAPDWMQRLESHRSLVLGWPEAERAATLTALRAVPGAEAAVLALAEDAAGGIVDVLGSGRIPLGLAPDWHLDFRSGHRFPEDWFWRIDHRDPSRPSDVKVPWEHARFHAGLWLGQAWRLTGEARYAEAFAELAVSFLAANPPGWGIHWLCPMELAIRAVNWIVALDLLADAPALTPSLRAGMHASLLWHGRVIRGNLEVGRHVGNHYVADLVGLLALGLLFDETAEGAGWRRFAHRELEAQIRWQVHADGVDFEKSTSYHRLVAELLLVALALGERGGLRFSPGYRARLSAMLDFTLAYTRPDGSSPVLGDADDGRILPFVPAPSPADHRALLALGGALLSRDDARHAAGFAVGDALWLAGPSRVAAGAAAPAAPPGGSRAFPSGGFYVLRSREAHLILDAGALGFDGTLGHGHFDTLSLEVWAAGAPLLVDRGCYCYTSDFDSYVAQVSARGHNTLTIDDAEPADLVGFWRIRADRTASVVERWITSERPDGVEEWVGTHGGYGTAGAPLRHRRAVRFERSRLAWEIDDTVTGVGHHRATIRWHCAPAVQVRALGGAWELAHAHARFRLESSVELELTEGWVAPRYGVRVPVSVLVGSVAGALPLQVATRLVRVGA